MKVEAGKTVRVHYTGTLEDGEVFDSSRERDPLEFEVGAGMMIAGFDAAVNGMSIGETKTVTIPCEEAYGELIPELIQDLEKSMFPDDMELAVGLQVQGQNENGDMMAFTIVDIKDDSVTVDGNHSLAGEDLTFEIELVEVVED